jgi:hypothetical protein
MERCCLISRPSYIGPLSKTAAVEIQALKGLNCIFAPARTRQPTDSPPAAGLPDDSDSSPCLAWALAPQVCDTDIFLCAVTLAGIEAIRKGVEGQSALFASDRVLLGPLPVGWLTGKVDVYSQVAHEKLRQEIATLCHAHLKTEGLQFVPTSWGDVSQRRTGVLEVI